MTPKIISRDDKDVIDEELIVQFADYVGQPIDGVAFFLHAGLEMIEQALNISLSKMTIEICIPESKHTVLLPFRNACDIISANIIHCDGTSHSVHPLNLRLAGGKLFLPVNDYMWEITYQTEPYLLDQSAKLTLFKIAEMMLEGAPCIKHSKIREMLPQYHIQIGSVRMPH